MRFMGRPPGLCTCLHRTYLGLLPFRYGWKNAVRSANSASSVRFRTIGHGTDLCYGVVKKLRRLLIASRVARTMDSFSP